MSFARSGIILESFVYSFIVFWYLSIVCFVMLCIFVHFRACVFWRCFCEWTSRHRPSTLLVILAFSRLSHSLAFRAVFVFIFSVVETLLQMRQCVVLYAGALCDERVLLRSSCSGVMCANGGTCVGLADGLFYCSCTSYFTGERCQLGTI